MSWATQKETRLFRKLPNCFSTIGNPIDDLDIILPEQFILVIQLDQRESFATSGIQKMRELKKRSIT